MARLTKKARRAAALKGWRNRTRKAPKRRNVGFSTSRAVEEVRNLAKRLRNRDSRLSREQSYRLAAKELGVAWESVSRYMEKPKSNPPSGFIPCKAVKIERKNGGVVVRVRR